MQNTFKNDRDELFFILGKLAGYLTRPELVEAVNKALEVPVTGEMTRQHLLIANHTLTLILAEDPARREAAH